MISVIYRNNTDAFVGLWSQHLGTQWAVTYKTLNTKQKGLRACWVTVECVINRLFYVI